MSNSRHYKPKLLKIQTEITTYYCSSCSLVHRSSEREGEGRSSTHCMRMPHFPYIHCKNVRKSIQTVYPDVIGFSKIWRMMVHVHAVSTRPSFSLPLRRLGDEANVAHTMSTCMLNRLCPIDCLYCCVGLMQVQPELAKLLELKAKLSEITDADPSGGKFVLKCPKVSQPAGRGSDTYMFGGKKVWDGGC